LGLAPKLFFKPVVNLVISFYASRRQTSNSSQPSRTHPSPGPRAGLNLDEVTRTRGICVLICSGLSSQRTWSRVLLSGRRVDSNRLAEPSRKKIRSLLRAFSFRANGVEIPMMRSHKWKQILILAFSLFFVWCGHAQAQSPTITSMSPAASPIGSPVTLTGTGFGASQGSSTISLNGTRAVATSWSDSTIVAIVPTGALSGVHGNSEWPAGQQSGVYGHSYSLRVDRSRHWFGWPHWEYELRERRVHLKRGGVRSAKLHE
jgi:IPT/TIG domain-containing protein